MKRFSLLGWGTVQLIFFEVIIPSSLLGWSTVEFCLFRCNIAEFTVEIKLVLTPLFLNVTTPSSLFRYETIQSVGMGNGSAYLFRSNNTEFSVGLEHG